VHPYVDWLCFSTHTCYNVLLIGRLVKGFRCISSDMVLVFGWLHAAAVWSPLTQCGVLNSTVSEVKKWLSPSNMSSFTTNTDRFQIEVVLHPCLSNVAKSVLGIMSYEVVLHLHSSTPYKKMLMPWLPHQVDAPPATMHHHRPKEVLRFTSKKTSQT
jgi:hypothetical protein